MSGPLDVIIELTGGLGGKVREGELGITAFVKLHGDSPVSNILHIFQNILRLKIPKIPIIIIQQRR